MLGGEPFGCLIGDYYFSHLPDDVELLQHVGKIAGAAQSPFISAAGPDWLNMDSWIELPNPPDVAKIFDTPEYEPLKELRDSDDARYLGLCLPRVLARLPYGAKSEPVPEFPFEEETLGDQGESYTWMNSCYTMAANINRAFKEYGWCSRIRGLQSGGTVANLPACAFPTDESGIALKCPTELAITDRREGELAEAGLMALVYRGGTGDQAAFIGAQSLAKAKTYQNNPEATAASNLSTRLPYLFAATRFMHYLKVMVRDKIDVSHSGEELMSRLNGWIADYVDTDPLNSSEEAKANRPLRGALISIDDSATRIPGYLSVALEIAPQYQLEGMDIGLRLVTRLPMEYVPEAVDSSPLA
jgi:type VI secretion system protein ImpC